MAPVSDLLVSAIRQATKGWLNFLAEAAFPTSQAAQRDGEALVDALARGTPLDRSMVGTLNLLIEFHVEQLTWQSGSEPVPRPPWVDVGPRLRQVRAILEEANQYLDDDVRHRLDECVRRAEGLKFRVDAEVETAENDLRRGELVRLPPRRPVHVSLGPVEWRAIRGTSPPRRRLFVQIGQNPVAIELMLRQDHADPRPRRLQLFARATGHPWNPLDYECLVTDGSRALVPRPVEGLDCVAGDPQLAGWHVAFLAHAGMWSVTVEDLRSPLGVYVRIPARVEGECCLCGDEIEARGGWTAGNNAQPLMSGRCCDKCDKEKVTPARAAQYVRNTAGQGEPKAQYVLGVMFVEGRGVPQDLVEAYKWFAVASVLASGEEVEKCAKQRDAVAEKLPPTQLAAGQEQAQEWLAAFEKRKKQ
jgi:hypothetical protein